MKIVLLLLDSLKSGWKSQNHYFSVLLNLHTKVVIKNLSVVKFTNIFVNYIFVYLLTILLSSVYVRVTTG